MVADNLNIHTSAALYETLPPEQGRSIVNKLEIHYTPKHGSWLNIAEIELSHLARQCLNRRIGNLQQLTEFIQQCPLKRRKNYYLKQNLSEK